jgi:uncharacterized membrane protein (DUF485 family)
MKTKKIVGLILRIPLYVLVLGSFAASIYAAYAKIQGVTYVTPIILGVIIITFIIGTVLGKQEKNQNQNQQQ